MFQPQMLGGGFTSILSSRRLSQLMAVDKLPSAPAPRKVERRTQLRSQSISCRRVGSRDDCVRYCKNIFKNSEYEVSVSLDGRLIAHKSTFLGKDEIIIEVLFMALGDELTAIEARAHSTSTQPIHASFIKRHLDRLRDRMEASSN